ncbi:hypothetical protein BDR04DRAFT_370889 [Suillus decipiens]|nr:hypothetical protein BDR04DRAFT_370889 [Suillus decipiens]
MSAPMAGIDDAKAAMMTTRRRIVYDLCDMRNSRKTAGFCTISKLTVLLAYIFLYIFI